MVGKHLLLHVPDPSGLLSEWPAIQRIVEPAICRYHRAIQQSCQRDIQAFIDALPGLTSDGKSKVEKRCKRMVLNRVQAKSTSHFASFCRADGPAPDPF